jgi:hypothetical protein
MQELQEYFREEQQFRQPWIWLIIGVSLLGIVPLWYGVYQQLVTGVPWGDEPTSDRTLLLIVAGMTLLVVGILYLFWNSRLVVSLSLEGVTFRFEPFHRHVRTIPWTEVNRAFVRTYRPIIEYGGWGIRFGMKGRAYNVSGNEGLQLELKNGRRVLFGTREAGRLAMVLTQIPGVPHGPRVGRL